MVLHFPIEVPVGADYFYCGIVKASFSILQENQTSQSVNTKKIVDGKFPFSCHMKIQENKLQSLVKSTEMYTKDGL